MRVRVLTLILDGIALGGGRFIHTLQAGSQSGLIHYGFFQGRRFTCKRRTKVTNAPKWVQNSGSFRKASWSQEMLFKKLLLYKKLHKVTKSH